MQTVDLDLATLDRWKGIPEMTIWHPTETVDFGEGDVWKPGESATIPYGYTPSVEARLVGFVYSHGQIEAFLHNQLTLNMVPKVEEFKRWIETPKSDLKPSSTTRGRRTRSGRAITATSASR